MHESVRFWLLQNTNNENDNKFVTFFLWSCYFYSLEIPQKVTTPSPRHYGYNVTVLFDVF